MWAQLFSHVAPKSNMNSDMRKSTEPVIRDGDSLPSPPFFGGSSAHCIGITNVARKRVSLPMFLRQVLRLFFMKTIIIHTVFHCIGFQASWRGLIDRDYMNISRKTCWSWFNERCLCPALACGFFHSLRNHIYSSNILKKGRWWSALLEAIETAK